MTTHHNGAPDIALTINNGDVQPPSQPQPLPSLLWSVVKKILPPLNGILYFAVAVEGGQNFKRITGTDGRELEVSIYIVSGFSCVIYMMFMFKTLEALSLNINSPSKIGFSLLAPFSAIAFLTAGKSGAESLHFSREVAIIVGVILFVLRSINCMDASVKFPDRLSASIKSLMTACQTHHYAEIVRQLVAWTASVGYVICTTDATYSAIKTIARLCNGNESLIHPLALSGAILGAIGTLPLNVYWSERGLRQLTFSGKINADGITPDPTDRYTYIGLITVMPIMLGVLGGATASEGNVFGQLGLAANVIRVITSLLYSAFAAMPGMATLLRTIFGPPELTNQLLQHQQSLLASAPPIPPVAGTSNRFFPTESVISLPSLASSSVIADAERAMPAGP